jgi:hypothetical protein
MKTPPVAVASLVGSLPPIERDTCHEKRNHLMKQPASHHRTCSLSQF